MTIFQMRHRLTALPTCRMAEGIAIRTFMPQDVPEWLALRVRAFGTERPSVRPWSEGDFAREMTEKPWWRNENTWLATAEGAPANIIGAVTLAMRTDVPVVHWLMVDPQWRRRGVAELLLTMLEQTVWQAGGREIRLETHAQWQGAVEFYRRLGYEVAFSDS